MDRIKRYTVEALLQDAGCSKNVVEAGIVAERLQEMRGVGETKPPGMDSSVWFIAHTTRFLRNPNARLSDDLRGFAKLVSSFRRDLIAIQVAITVCLLLDTSRASVSWGEYAKALLAMYTATLPTKENSLSKALSETLKQVSVGLPDDPKA